MIVEVGAATTMDEVIPLIAKMLGFGSKKTQFAKFKHPSGQGRIEALSFSSISSKPPSSGISIVNGWGKKRPKIGFYILVQQKG